MTNKVLLAIDPGTQITGWCAMGDGWAKVGLIEMDRKTPLHLRLYHLYVTLAEIAHRFQPKEICVERGFVSGAKRGNKFAALAIAEARAMAKLVAAVFSCTLVEVDHQTAKKFLTGRGNAKKHEVQAAANTFEYFKKPLKEDEADAFAIALFRWNNPR